ncbi:hypothetical protein ANN_03292 [Periplaneta americana]|uniref:Uncharacterized protein n=1 Tax=Periplaneta americana TaxID=6978 RepID=A0ABQ8U1F8_PERAM|nr:hypothetical protein ANN_03292 [Periplaneta americana]
MTTQSRDEFGELQWVEKSSFPNCSSSNCSFILEYKRRFSIRKRIFAETDLGSPADDVEGFGVTGTENLRVGLIDVLNILSISEDADITDVVDSDSSASSTVTHVCSATRTEWIEILTMIRVGARRHTQQEERDVRRRADFRRRDVSVSSASSAFWPSFLASRRWFIFYVTIILLPIFYVQIWCLISKSDVYVSTASCSSFNLSYN